MDLRGLEFLVHEIEVAEKILGLEFETVFSFSSTLGAKRYEVLVRAAAPDHQHRRRHQDVRVGKAGKGADQLGRCQRPRIETRGLCLRNGIVVL